MTYIGVDIGNEGALAILEDGYISDILSMPITTLAKRKTVDRSMLMANLAALDDGSKFIIEECSHHLQSQKVAASMWFGFRGILDVVEDLGLRYVIVPAKVWQKDCFKASNTKSQSISTVKSLFPGLSLKRTDKSKKDDDNYADAVLLAEYGRRKNL